MAKLLKIDVSPRGEHSVSRKLGKEFLTRWQASHPGGQVVTRDLAQTDLPFVELPWILGAYSDPATHTAEQKAALAIGDTLIAELEAADEYLLTTPMYNFAVPARLKAYIDHVARAGKTFRANPDGSYTGLLTGKKATVLIASAGVYTQESGAKAYNAEQPYLQQILGFLGVTDVKFVEVGGTWKVDKGMATADELIAPHTRELETLVTA